MSNFKFVDSVQDGYEVVTNMPLDAVDEALEEGFIVVDAATWKPVDIRQHSNSWIAEMFYEGGIDLIRKKANSRKED